MYFVFSKSSVTRRGQLRLTFSVAEVASGASNLSAARRGARFYSSFPARVRVSEQMKRSEMFRERARTEHRSELASVGAERLRLVIRSFCAEMLTHRGEARMPSPIPPVSSLPISSVRIPLKSIS